MSVEFWEWGSDNLFQELIDGYTAIHPNVSIKLVNNPWDDYWTKLPLSLGGANGPAIFNVHNSQHENLINYMAPYEVSSDDLDADFNGVSAHVIDGKVYYIDYGIMTGSVYYNKDMWEAAGLTDADYPKTWDEMPQFLEKASDVGADGKTNRYGMVIPGWITWYYEPFFVNNGVQMVTPEGRTDLASDNSIKLVSQLKDWCQKGYTYLATGEDAASVMRQNFIDGKALSIVYTSSLFDTMADSCSFDVGMEWLPGGKTKEQELGGNVLFLPAKNDQKVKDASWEFLSYLMSKEVNMIWASESGYLPTRKSVQETEEGKAFLEKKPEFQIIFDNLDVITPGIQRSDWSQASTTWKNWMDEIIQEDLDVESALTEMAEEIDEILGDS